MKNQYLTYMKREIKKVYPLVVVGIVFLLLCAVMVVEHLSGQYEQSLLSLSGHEISAWGTYLENNQFLWTIFDTAASGYFIFAIVIFLVVLLQRTFWQENRSGIADFLQVLPLKERDKMAMKLINGHLAIATYVVSFGVIMSIACGSVNDKLREISGFYYQTYENVNPYVVIWQSVLLQFLGMSAIYLLFFLVISCIHSRILAYLVGIGLLISPAAFCEWYDEVLQRSGEGKLIAHIFNPFYFFPETTYVTSAGDFYSDNAKLKWEYYSSHVIFLVAIIIVAGALIALAVSKKWHIREAYNVLMNQEGAAQFVITGISLCGGLFGAEFIMELVFYDIDGISMTAYWILALIITLVMYAIISGIRILIEKRQQEM